METRRAETQTWLTTDYPEVARPNARPDEEPTKTSQEDFPMVTTGDDGTVYCVIRMPLVQERELY